MTSRPRLPPSIRGVGLALLTVSVEHAPAMHRGSGRNDREAEPSQAIGHEHAQADAEDHRTDA